MINGSFVFGMDDDDERRVPSGRWTGRSSTASRRRRFTSRRRIRARALFARMEAAGRILTRDWDLYDTRHVVYRPARLTPTR